MSAVAVHPRSWRSRSERIRRDEEQARKAAELLDRLREGRDSLLEVTSDIVTIRERNHIAEQVVSVFDNPRRRRG